MIKSVKVTNHLGNSLTMELRFPEKSGFLIKNITGIGPNKADINTTDMSILDGSLFNSSRVPPRNIVFELGFLEREIAYTIIGEKTVEDIRHKSYKYFPLKREIKIEIETDKRTCEIYGYVESNEPNIFSNEEDTIISIICPDPYLYDVNSQSTRFGSITPLFSFPFSNESLVTKLIKFGSIIYETEKSIYYQGDFPIGIVIYIHAIGGATDVEIINSTTLESIFIDDAKMIALTGGSIQAGDDIIISTVRGDKYASLIRSGVETNILGVLDPNPSWFELEKGDNIFAYTALTGLSNLQFTIINKVAYEGI